MLNAIIASFVSLLFAGFLISRVNKSPAGEGRMNEISNAIKEGAMAFLKRQYKTCFLVAVAIFFILYFHPSLDYSRF